MTSVPESTDAPPPPCPTCGLNAYRAKVITDADYVSTGSYVCPEGHLWITKWLEVAA